MIQKTVEDRFGRGQVLVVGDDEAGRRLGQLLEDSGVATTATATSDRRPTVTKTRVLGGHQPMLRIDEEVVAPVPAPVNVTLANLDPNTPDIQAAIIASISDMLLITAAPGGTVYPSDLYEAISATPDVVHFTMTSPTQPFVAAVGGLPVMGNLTVLAG